VSETTLASKNASVWNYVHNDSLPYWVRITVANYVFVNQSYWAQTYLKYNSGTYNNQWILVDFGIYDNFSRKITDAENIVWLVEEFYGYSS